MSPLLGCSVHSRRPSTSAGAPRNTLDGSLSVDMETLAQKDFLGSGGSWLSRGTVRTRGLVREGAQDTEAAGRTRGRWHCVA